MNDSILRAMACRAWDGVWRIKQPVGFNPVVGIHQFTALQVLRSGAVLSEADARLLQAIYYQANSLSPAQLHNLEKLTRLASQHVDGRIAA